MKVVIPDTKSIDEFLDKFPKYRQFSRKWLTLYFAVEFICWMTGDGWNEVMGEFIEKYPKEKEGWLKINEIRMIILNDAIYNNDITD